jgi:alpha-1,3-glucosyltransferase
MVDPRWMALDASRGIEGDGIKLFMRASAWLSDVLIYVPAILFFFASSPIKVRSRYHRGDGVEVYNGGGHGAHASGPHAD